MAPRRISKSLSAHLKKLLVHGKDIVEFKLLDEHLSRVRNQEDIGACSIVATIACIETLYRMFDKPLFEDWDDKYYFDLNECFDLLYKELNTLDDAMLLAHNPDLGVRVQDVFVYVMERGLLATTICMNPRDRNYVAHFDNEAHRYHINGYKNLEHDEILKCLEDYPVIAYMNVNDSFTKWKKAIYEGEGITELGQNLSCHAVLVVGKVKINDVGTQKQYLVIQNSYGVKYGFRGYVLVPFNQSIFICFWLPLVNTHMKDLPYGKLQKEQSPKKVYSRRINKRKLMTSQIDD